MPWKKNGTNINTKENKNKPTIFCNRIFILDIPYNLKTIKKHMSSSMMRKEKATPNALYLETSIGYIVMNDNR